MNILSFLVFTYSLSLGLDSGAFLNYETDPYTWQDITWPLFVDLAAEVQIEQFFIGGSIRCDFNPTGFADFDPLQNTYMIRTGLRFNPSPELQIEIGVQHNCFHPEAAYITQHFLTGQIVAIPKYEGGLTTAWLTIRGHIGGLIPTLP